MALITLFVFFVSFNILHEDTNFARTTALLSLICLEIANAYNFMSFRRKVILETLKVNKYLLYASIISIIATIFVIYSPLNKVFGTVPLGFTGWAIGILSALIIVVIFNLLKKLNDKKNFLKLEHF